MKLKLSAVAITTTMALIGLPAQAQVSAKRDRVGDTLQYVLPAGAVALSLYEDDAEGLKQFGYSFALAQGSSEVLKHVVRSRRPDGTGLGFPSGHTSAAFASATYVYERYGVERSLPFFGLAALTAYSRVHTHHHFTKDVIGGAAVGVTSALVFTRPLGGQSTAWLGYGPDGVSLQYARRW